MGSVKTDLQFGHLKRRLTVYDRMLIAKSKTNSDSFIERLSSTDEESILRTKRFQKFQRKYGDIIGFPLHYDHSRPSPTTLAALWNLFPVMGTHTVDKNATHRTISLEIKLNANFSDAAILQEAERILRYALADERDEFSPSWFLMGAKRWEHFNQQILAYDLNVESGAASLGW